MEQTVASLTKSLRQTKLYPTKLAQMQRQNIRINKIRIKRGHNNRDQGSSENPKGIY